MHTRAPLIGGQSSKHDRCVSLTALIRHIRVARLVLVTLTCTALNVVLLCAAYRRELAGKRLKAGAGKGVEGEEELRVEAVKVEHVRVSGGGEDASQHIVLEGGGGGRGEGVRAAGGGDALTPPPYRRGLEPFFSKKELKVSTSPPSLGLSRDIDRDAYAWHGRSRPEPAKIKAEYTYTST